MMSKKALRLKYLKNKVDPYWAKIPIELAQGAKK
jgi:hypothetical protein